MATDTMPINVRLSKPMIEHLKRVARYEAFERDEDITYADLIREAVERTFPMAEGENGNQEDES